MKRRIVLVFIALLFCSAPAFAQTLDQFGIAGAHNATQTVSVTVNSHTNQVLYLRIHWFCLVSPSDNISSVTVNGTVSGVNVVSGSVAFNGTSAYSVAMYRVINPTVGTYNAVVTFPNTVDGDVEYFTVYGADQTSPERSVAVNSCTTSCGSTTLSITSATGDLILDGVTVYVSAIVNPTNGQSVKNTDAHDTIQAVGGTLAGSTGTVALGWTLTGTSFTWAEDAVSIQAPFAHSGSPNLLTLGVGVGQ